MDSHNSVKHKTQDVEKSLFFLIISFSLSILLLSECTLYMYREIFPVVVLPCQTVSSKTNQCTGMLSPLPMFHDSAKGKSTLVLLAGCFGFLFEDPRAKL